MFTEVWPRKPVNNVHSLWYSSCLACTLNINGGLITCAADCVPHFGGTITFTFGDVAGTTTCAGTFTSCPAGTITDNYDTVDITTIPPTISNVVATCIGTGYHCCCK
ncbi:unnamed protein product [Rotaria sp. Silwood1]|nr:unnamed protein product [Rotaria sp. Silwood1]